MFCDFCRARRRRLTLLTLFVAFVALFLYCFLIIYWPALSNLFSQRGQTPLEQNDDETGSNERKCLFPVDSDRIPEHDEGPPRRRVSLLARPLKHTANSLSVRELTLTRLQSLIKHDENQTTWTVTNPCTKRTFWALHRKESNQDRLNRLGCFCRSYDFSGQIFTYRASTSNRQYGSSEENPISQYCSTKTCPILVDGEHQVLTCFVQKIASTSIKQIFTQLAQTGQDRNQSTPQPELVSNLTYFHQTANENLFRVSPVYIRHAKEAHYFKALFVRHPFVRLVSAFKDKAERGPEFEPYFYTEYWNPLFNRIYGPNKWNTSTRITFAQFVDQLLLTTEPYLYDEHWAPVWSRCDPCFMGYDFIGKLESSDSDFYYFKSKIDQSLLNFTIWENRNRQFGVKHEAKQMDEKLEKKCKNGWLKNAETRRYLKQLTPESIIELYKKYYLDFELFGYSLEELFQ